MPWHKSQHLSAGCTSVCPNTDARAVPRGHQGGHLQLPACISSLQPSTTLHPQPCLALGQLWVLNSRKETVAGKEEEQEEQEEGSDEDGTSIILIWSTGSCSATSGLIVMLHPMEGQERFPTRHTPTWEWSLPPQAGSGWRHFHVLRPLVTLWSPAGKSKRCCSGSSERAMAQAAPLSCPYHGPLSRPCVLSHRAGLYRHIGLGEQQGLALVLLSFCSSRALKELWVGTLRGKLGDAPGAAGQGNTAPQLGRGAPMAGGSVRHTCLRREERQLGAYAALSMSLPTAQDKGNPGDPSAKHLTPAEGGKLLPCSVSALGCRPSRAAEHHCSPSSTPSLLPSGGH